LQVDIGSTYAKSPEKQGGLKIVLDNPTVILYSQTMRKEMKVGQTVEVPEWQKLPGVPYFGTITQAGKNKVRVLFPIRKFVWLEKSRVKVCR
jgi:hypothetical protein